MERYEEIRALTDGLKSDCRTALDDAHVLGGELGASTKKAIDTLYDVDKKIEKQNASAYEDLRTIQHNLADVMISSFQSLRDEGTHR